MVKRFLISCGIAFAALAAKATPDDSIKVVKGQVSDYYITVTQDRIVKGHVLDTNRQPLAGATVMFFASPMHNTTAHDGSFAIKGAKNDVHLYVYYPGYTRQPQSAAPPRRPGGMTRRRLCRAPSAIR